MLAEVWPLARAEPRESMVSLIVILEVLAQTYAMSL